MTKIKNTKKGMAKKTLSMSLVVAMLATSNVPVWAAEFSDGTDAAVATEAPAAETFSDETAEAPVVEDTTADVSPASTIVNEGNMSIDLSTEESSVVWGASSDKITVKGTVNKDGAAATSWKYRWVDENGIAVTNNTITVSKYKDMNAAVAAMSLDVSGSTYAGKTLTLYIYDENPASQTLYDIKTGVTITVEKQNLKDVAEIKGVTDLKYNGFARSFNTESVSVEKKSDSSTIDSKYYALTSTSATNAGDEIIVTASADDVADSPYKGSISVTKKIVAKTYNKDDKGNDSVDIIANVNKGLSFPYTGKTVHLSKDNVTVAESKSKNNGDDGKLSGADLSGAFKDATVTGTKAGASYPVSVTLDGSKLTNFANESGNALNDTVLANTENTVEITKRDLSAAGTKISVNTASGYVPVTATSASLSKYLTFTGVEGTDIELAYDKDYVVYISDGKVTLDPKKELTNGKEYTVTVEAKDGGNCKNKQDFKVIATSATLESVTHEHEYTTPYTGEAIQPSKTDLGKLYINYIGDDGQTKNELLDPDAYEITGYTNNTDASGLDSKGKDYVKKAYANIKITSGTYKDQTAAIPFIIEPLKVEASYITVPEDVAINNSYKKASDYKVALTVVAKDSSEKKVQKTLTADDFTVDYAWKTPATGNEVGNYITSIVTITNKNYILGTSDGKTYKVQKNKADFVGETKIVAKKLTDSMVVVNPSSYTYTGGKITPNYAVIDGAIALYKKGDIKDDTKAEYEEVSITDAVNVGTGTIKVKGINDFYSGTATGTFTITAANTSDVKVTIENEDYTGKQVRPRMNTINVTLNGNDVTNQFEIVSYGENKEAGKGTVVLKPVDGNKNFTGSNITAEFNIIKEKVTGKLNVYNSKGFEDSSHIFDYDGNAHTFAKAVLTLDKSNKTTAKESDFEIKYVDNVAGKKSTQKDSDGNPINIGYVYAVAKEGTGFAGDGKQDIVTADGTIIKGVVAKVPVKIRSVQFVDKNVSLKNATYAAGLPVKPEVTIQIGGTTLVEGKDYTLKLIKDGSEIKPTDVSVGNIYGVEIVGINGYEGSKVTSSATNKLYWGVDKKNLKDCNVTVKDGVVSVVNGYIPVASTEYTSKNNSDGTYTVTAVSTSKNYTGSVTVKADGKAEDEKPNAPMISSVKVVGNQATAILSGDSEGAAGYDYVISTDRDCIKNKDYASVNKNQVSTSTTFKYVQQGTYYAYCHAWKRDANGKKVFSDWSNAYPFVVSAITPDAPVITNVKVSGSTIKVTYKAAANATGYDVVLGTSSKKENGETRPYHYGNHKVLNLKEGTVTATFKKVPKGTWVVGMHAFNRTSEDGKKVFSPWSNLKKATVK
ncbi:hypothetical protein DW903_17690 [Ruminococcus sp. AM42-10AC]|nr:hypothetical protein DW903_17690 [Ruminococcus sp. AM42-10AC]